MFYERFLGRGSFLSAQTWRRERCGGVDVRIYRCICDLCNGGLGVLASSVGPRTFGEKYSAWMRL
jgi:hypothetical protein